MKHNSIKMWVDFYNNRYKEFFISIKALESNPDKENIYKNYLKSELEKIKANYMARNKNIDNLVKLDSIQGQFNQIKAIESII